MRNYLYKANSARIYMLFKFYRTAIIKYGQIHLNYVSNVFIHIIIFYILNALWKLL